MKGIEGDTGANLDIDSDKDPAKVKISGTKESIAKAKMAVMRIVEPPCVSFSCPRRLIPRLIGAKGAKIRELQEAYGVRIQVEQVDIASPPRGGSEALTRAVSSGGNPHGARITISEDVAPSAWGGAKLSEAEKAVKKIVEPFFELISCPESCISALLGDDGENIIELRRECGDVAGTSIRDESTPSDPDPLSTLTLSLILTVVWRFWYRHRYRFGREFHSEPWMQGQNPNLVPSRISLT